MRLIGWERVKTGGRVGCESGSRAKQSAIKRETSGWQRCSVSRGDPGRTFKRHLHSRRPLVLLCSFQDWTKHTLGPTPHRSARLQLISSAITEMHTDHRKRASTNDRRLLVDELKAVIRRKMTQKKNYSTVLIVIIVIIIIIKKNCKAPVAITKARRKT